MSKWSNVEDGVQSYQIATTGDYLINRGGEWFFWLDTTSPTENHGPYSTAEDAIKAYNRVGESYTLADVDADPADLA